MIVRRFQSLVCAILMSFIVDRACSVCHERIAGFIDGCISCRSRRLDQTLHMTVKSIRMANKLYGFRKRGIKRRGIMNGANDGPEVDNKVCDGLYL